MATGLTDLSTAELSSLIAARTLSPVELVEALIRRVEDYDAQTHAFITPTFDLARQQARAAEAEIAAGKHRGPLHGIPFALKDIYDTRGILTSGHSRVFIDRIPAEDATATRRLYDAGAVLLGKLATHEMAHAGPSFDHCGPLARTVEDCALVLQALAGYDPKDAGSVRRDIPSYREALRDDLRGLRIGVLRHHWEEDIPATEDVRNAMDAALDVLRRLGATLEECSVRPLAAYFDVKIVIAESEIFSVQQANLQTRAKDFGADFRSRVLPSVLFTAHDYVQATREHRRMMVEMEPLYARFDAFVTAGMGEAPSFSDYHSVSFWQKPSLLTAWNVTSQPVLMLPNGFGRNGLPLGMQIVGRPFGETTILRVGHAYERATAWHTRRPQLARGAAAPDVVPPPVLSSGADQVDAETRDLCVKSARRAGVQLDDLMLAQLLEGAPYALAMVERLRRFRLG